MSVLQERSFFHEGMREFQDELDGRRVADAIERHRKHYSLWDSERELIQGAQFFFIASTFKEYVDCSIKSGDPGFVKIISENVIEYPEYDGNSMYRTLGNIKRNPNVGLLFVRFDGKSNRIRINGRASIHTEPEFLERHFGAKFVVRIECELYPNCPRYVPSLTEKASSLYVPRKDEAPPPTPEWKRRDYIREVLPRDDPHRKEVWIHGPDESWQRESDEAPQLAIGDEAVFHGD